MKLVLFSNTAFRMKRKLSFLLLFFISTVISGQNNEEQKHLLTTNTRVFRFSSLNIKDPYLSPLEYRGNGFGYNNQKRRFLSIKNKNISFQNSQNLFIGSALNLPRSALMYYFEMNYSCGLHYHYRQLNSIKVLIGGLCDVDFGFKNIERNVNNPINIDLSTNLNLSGVAIYDIVFFRTDLRLQLAVQSPVIGYMFVPKVGASYYEMFQLGNLSGTTHFSSLHNKRGIQANFSIDVPFSRSIWRIGLNYNRLKYSANEMVFNRDEMSLMIGTTHDIATFAGRNKKAPKNFISTNE